MSEWMPIDEAPKDGTRIWCWFPMANDSFAVAWRCNPYEKRENWTLDDSESATLTYDPPTHWMPLPEPPKD